MMRVLWPSLPVLCALAPNAEPVYSPEGGPRNNMPLFFDLSRKIARPTVRDHRRSKSLGRLLFLRGFSAGIHLPPASCHHVHGGSILHHPWYKVPSASQEPTHAHGKARGGRGLLATRRS